VRVILSYNSKGKYGRSIASSSIHRTNAIVIVNFLNSDIWTQIHSCTGVICVNLPTFKPLFPKITAFTSSIRRRYANLRSGTTRNAGTQISNKNIDGDSSYLRMSGSQEGVQSTASASKTVNQDTYELDRLDTNHIRVQKTVDQEIV
jgi:hypothetical protein